MQNQIWKFWIVLMILCIIAFTLGCHNGAIESLGKDLTELDSRIMAIENVLSPPKEVPAFSIQKLPE